MVVSILISTRNRLTELVECLASIQAISIPHGLQPELIIIDNGSTDGTSAHLRNYCGSNDRRIQTRVLNQPVAGKSRALNLGMSRARGVVLLFTDDDLRFPENWIGAMCEPILSQKADLVQGGIKWAPDLARRVPEGSYLFAAITSTRHKTEKELSNCLIGANMAFSRRVCETVGDFDEELGPGALGLAEETLYAYQSVVKGFRKTNVLQTEVEHHFDASRLTRKGLLDLAQKKGRSSAFIDYHWNHVQPRHVKCHILRYHLKDFIRTLGCHSAFTNPIIPEWKFSYQASIAFHRQLLLESGKPRKYPRLEACSSEQSGPGVCKRCSHDGELHSNLGTLRR